MRILFLVYHGFSEHSGISKKIHYQINALRANGNTVYVCTYDILNNGVRARLIDNKILEDYGKGKLASLKKRCCYQSIIDFVKDIHIDFVYTRSFHNANPFTIHLFHALKKMKVKSVIEIPTFPYDQEYEGFSRKERMELKIDQLFRNRLAKETDAIVTFTNDATIFGQKTIQISNGIELESIALRKEKDQPSTANAIHLLGVAEVHYWHGFDRLIHGMGEYYKNGGSRNVIFDIVGGVADSEMHDSMHAPGFYELIQKYQLADHVVFHGQKFGKELDMLFDQADFAIGSLGRHRSGITHIKTLKNREYAARGISFIYSETDSDFDDKPYILKVSPDESPIDIQQILDYLEKPQMTPSEIRATLTNLTWKCQMKRVIEAVF